MGVIKRRSMYDMRIRYGMSQAELAAAAGISTPTISLWERGKSDPSMFALQSVCDALGATLTEYVTGNAIDPPKTAQRGAEAAIMKRNRKDAKYSRARLARNAGISEQSLFSYETGLREPRLSAMQKLASALGMTIDEYIGFAPKNY